MTEKQLDALHAILFIAAKSREAKHDALIHTRLDNGRPIDIRTNEAIKILLELFFSEVRKHGF